MKRRRPVEKRAKTKNQARRRRKRRSEKVKENRHIPMRRRMRRRRSIVTLPLEALLMERLQPSLVGKKGRKMTRNVGKSTTAAAAKQPRKPRTMLPPDPRWFQRCIRLVPGTRSSHQNMLQQWMIFPPSRHQRVTGKFVTMSLTVTPARGRRPRTLDSITAPLALGTSARHPLASRGGGSHLLDTDSIRLSPHMGEGEIPGLLSDGGSNIQGPPLVTSPGHHPLGDVYLVLPSGAPGPLSPVGTTPVRPDQAEDSLKPRPEGTTPPGPLSEPRGVLCGIPRTGHVVSAPGPHTGGFPGPLRVRGIEITACHRTQRLATVPRRVYRRRIASVV